MLVVTWVEDRQYTFIEKTFLENADELLKVFKYASNKNGSEHLLIHPQIDEMPINKGKMNPATMYQITAELINTEYHGWRHVYTDASKTANSCGIGVFEHETKLEISLKLAEPCCTMTAELFAIWMAATEIKNMEQKETVILTDSQAACLHLEKCRGQDKLDELSLKTCNMLAETKTVVQWIPAHIGIPGNEKADELAKTGTVTAAILQNKLLACDLKNRIYNQMHVLTDEWYRDMALVQQKGRTFFDLAEHFPKRPWYWKTKFNGDEVRLLNRILAGHDYSK